MTTKSQFVVESFVIVGSFVWLHHLMFKMVIYLILGLEISFENSSYFFSTIVSYKLFKANVKPIKLVDLC
jgi:hypothetical protein